MTASLLILGDFCLENSGTPVLSPELQNMMDDCDFVSVNLEGPVRCDAEPALKVGPHLMQDSETISLLRGWGVNMLALANNHIMDYGTEGLRETLLSTKEFICVGAGLNFDDVYSYTVREVSGIRIAFAAFSEAQFGVLLDEEGSFGGTGYSWIGHPQARHLIRRAREEADIVILQAHAGLESVHIPLPEWRSCYREFIDMGADIVIGHHPHVVQGQELYKGKYIYYSLGNMYMDRSFATKDQCAGGGVVVNISENNELKTQWVNIRSEKHQISIDKTSEAQASFEHATYILRDGQAYRREVAVICDQFWEKYYSRYYEKALNGFGIDVRFLGGLRFIKQIAKKVLPKYDDGHKENALMLIHNVQIESHRWVVQRALYKIVGS